MAEDYPWIRQWGRLMNSPRSYVDDEIAHARADLAPHNALFRQRDGTWRTTDDVTCTKQLADSLYKTPPEPLLMPRVLARHPTLSRAQ